MQNKFAVEGLVMCNIINSDIFYHIVILSDIGIATCMHMIVSMKVYL